MRLIAAVAVGGAFGSVARYLIQGWVQDRSSAGHGWTAVFPFGTLAVNVLGCLLIGIFGVLFQDRILVAPEVRSLLLIGLLGGFTTFSSFGFETLALLRDGNLALAVANVGVSVAFGLAGVWLGMSLARLL